MSQKLSALKKQSRFNPILDICKYIIFREKPVSQLSVQQNLVATPVWKLSRAGNYSEGKLHPMDLKSGVCNELGNILEPVRRYFENNKDAKDCLETIRQAKITR